jgi:hypothetical protein
MYYQEAYAKALLDLEALKEKALSQAPELPNNRVAFTPDQLAGLGTPSVLKACQATYVMLAGSSMNGCLELVERMVELHTNAVREDPEPVKDDESKYTPIPWLLKFGEVSTGLYTDGFGGDSSAVFVQVEFRY